jgi:hypothetical protein
MLPLTLQFLIAMIASAINERTKRKLDYALEEVQVVKEAFRGRHRQRADSLGGLLNYCHRAAA